MVCVQSSRSGFKDISYIYVLFSTVTDSLSSIEQIISFALLLYPGLGLALPEHEQCIPSVLFRALLPPVQPYRFDFSTPVDAPLKPHILSAIIIAISLSLHLVLLASINSCSLNIILY